MDIKVLSDSRKEYQPEEFRRIIRGMAGDVDLMWNKTIDRWQVFQVNVSPILALDGSTPARGSLMWTIETEDGSYRLPNEGDLRRLTLTLRNFKQLQSIGEDKYADKLDARDKAKSSKLTAKTEDTISQAAKEIAKAMREGKV